MLILLLPQISFFDLQLGYGKNIGDGYRSLLATDGASPYPYFKLNTTLENKVYHLYVA
jgi:hypothetical protein